MTLSGIQQETAETIDEGAIPSIESVFSRQPGIMGKQMIPFLQHTLCESIAPLLLMSAAGLRAVEGIGKARALFIREALEDAQLRLRLEEERVHERAKRLFGSVGNTPVQALLVISSLSGGYTSDSFRPSPAVRLVARLTPSLTIGELAPYLKSRDMLMQYFELAGCAVDDRHVRDTHAELESRLQPWRLSLKP